MPKVIVTGTGCLTQQQAKRLSDLHRVHRTEKARLLIDFIAIPNGTALLCEELPVIYDRDAIVVEASAL